MERALDRSIARSTRSNQLVSRCDPFQKNQNLFWRRAATLRVAGAPEGCRFAAAGPNNVRQESARSAVRTIDHYQLQSNSSKSAFCSEQFISFPSSSLISPNLQLWDTRSRKLLSTLNCRTVEDSEFLYCGQFYTQDKVICGGSGVRNAKLVDTVENKVV